MQKKDSRGEAGVGVVTKKMSEMDTRNASPSPRNGEDIAMKTNEHFMPINYKLRKQQQQQFKQFIQHEMLFFSEACVGHSLDLKTNNFPKRLCARFFPSHGTLFK